MSRPLDPDAVLAEEAAEIRVNVHVPRATSRALLELVSRRGITVSSAVVGEGHRVSVRIGRLRVGVVIE